MTDPNRSEDQALVRLELSISYFLRFGVLLAAAFLAVGWVGQLFNPQDLLTQFHDYAPATLSTTLQTALAAHDWAQLFAIAGLGILVSLPILRVIFTAILFMKQKDWYLAGMAVFVFSMLLASFFLGINL